MPEGPEVLVIQEGLAKLLTGKAITAIAFNSKSRYNSKAPDGYVKFSSDLVQTANIKVTGVHSKGKFIWWEFSNGWHMWQTLGLSGGWFHHKKANSGLELTYVDSNGKLESLYYDDQRRFGTLKFIHPSESKFETDAKVKSLGPNILGPHNEFSADIFKARMAKSTLATKQVGSVIADQKVLSGVGNYLRAEALYRAKISPFRLVNTLTPSDLTALYQAITWAAHESYKAGGASIRHYSDIDDVKGRYEYQMQVYGRKKTPEGKEVKAEKLTGDTQTIYYCPEVQI